MSENLKRHRPDIKVLGEGRAIAFMPEDPMGVWCHIQEVRDLLDVKDKVIAELKRKLQDQCISCPVKMQEDDVFAEKDNEIRRLKHTLWLARAERAKEFRYKIKFAISSMNTKYNYSDADKWEEVERKCLKKAEEYK